MQKSEQECFIAWVPEDGRAVELPALPEALLDHGFLVLDTGCDPVDVETWQLAVPQNIELKRFYR